MVSRCEGKSALFGKVAMPGGFGKRPPFGFTLLELLVSITVLALILVAVLGALQVGSRSWESGERRAEENQRTRTLFEALARELTALYPLRVKEGEKEVVVFRGQADSLEFATLPQSYGSEPRSFMVRIVRYAVEPDRGLIATENYPLLGAGSGGGQQDSHDRRLDERVSAIRLRYLVPEGRPEERRPPGWRDSWDPSMDEAVGGQPSLKGSARLPLAVEMTMTVHRPHREGIRELILPPLVFPVQVGRGL